MRMRWIGLAAVLLLVTGLVAFSRPDGRASAQDATPAAEATPEPDDDGELSRIATLIGWYALNESGQSLIIGPLESNANLVAGPVSDTTGQLTGRVDLDYQANDGLPWIQIGEAEFNGFPPNEDDPDSVLRWIHYDDDPSLRPATLVVQIEGANAPYEGCLGTATFVSRTIDPSSGVVVIVLNCPEE